MDSFMLRSLEWQTCQSFALLFKECVRKRRKMLYIFSERSYYLTKNSIGWTALGALFSFIYHQFEHSSFFFFSIISFIGYSFLDLGTQLLLHYQLHWAQLLFKDHQLHRAYLFFFFWPSAALGTAFFSSLSAVLCAAFFLKDSRAVLGN